MTCSVDEMSETEGESHDDQRCGPRRRAQGEAESTLGIVDQESPRRRGRRVRMGPHGEDDAGHEHQGQGPTHVGAQRSQSEQARHDDDDPGDEYDGVGLVGVGGRREADHGIAVVEEPVSETPQDLGCSRGGGSGWQRFGVGQHRGTVSSLYHQSGEPPGAHRDRGRTENAGGDERGTNRHSSTPQGIHDDGDGGRGAGRVGRGTGPLTSKAPPPPEAPTHYCSSHQCP